MLKQKNKRGSHVGIVLSFVLFITFIFFMYGLLNLKVNQEKGKLSTLEYIKGELLDGISAQLMTTSVSMNSPGSNCVTLTNFFSETGISNKVIARNDAGDVLETGVSGQDLQVARDGAFFRVHNSEEFAEKTNSIGSCSSLDYNIGLSKEENFVFESKVTELLSDYLEDYETLKENLNIGSRDEFGFIFAYKNGTVIKTPEKNLTINIFADQIPIQYIRTNGAREAGTLTVLVW